jgi:type IV secretory pathway TrbL component
MEFYYLHWAGYSFQPAPKNEPYGSKVVLQLMAPVLNQVYRVIMNNWFSSLVRSFLLALRLPTQQAFINESSSVTVCQVGHVCLSLCFISEH